MSKYVIESKGFNYASQSLNSKKQQISDLKKSILKQQVKEVFALSNFEQKLEKIIASGCINLDNVSDENYREAKNIVVALFEDAAEGLKPFSDKKQNEKDINNIKNFI